jgi:hypothetical protein
MQDLHALADQEGLRGETTEGQRVVAWKDPQAREFLAFTEQATQGEGCGIASARMGRHVQNRVASMGPNQMAGRHPIRGATQTR